MAELGRQLSLHEGYVQNALTALDLQKWPRYAPVQAKSDDYAAKLGELIPVDTSDGSTVTVRLPESTAANGGLSIAILRLSAAGTIKVISQSDIDGAGPALTLPATEGLYQFLSEGA